MAYDEAKIASLANRSFPERTLSAEGPATISVSIDKVKPASAVTPSEEVYLTIPVTVTEDTNTDSDNDSVELAS